MSDSSAGSSDRLDEIIAEYLAAEEAGEAPPRDELLQQHADLADELREFFADQDRVKAAAGGLPGELPHRQFVPPTVRYFGDYELIDEIARGGMGVVYRAKQTSLNRIVAIKMISKHLLASTEQVQRFLREVRVAATLENINIVRAYDADQSKGIHFLVMEYVSG